MASQGAQANPPSTLSFVDVLCASPSSATWLETKRVLWSSSAWGGERDESSVLCCSVLGPLLLELVGIVLFVGQTKFVNCFGWGDGAVWCGVVAGGVGSWSDHKVLMPLDCHILVQNLGSGHTIWNSSRRHCSLRNLTVFNIPPVFPYHRCCGSLTLHRQSTALLMSSYGRKSKLVPRRYCYVWMSSFILRLRFIHSKHTILPSIDQ